MSEASDSKWTRRGFLAAGVVTGVGALIVRPLRGGEPPVSSTPVASPRLITKAIPSSGE